jgi:hypothetical protein
VLSNRTPTIPKDPDASFAYSKIPRRASVSRSGARAMEPIHSSCEGRDGLCRFRFSRQIAEDGHKFRVL